jgi:hypothetical protein
MKTDIIKKYNKLKEEKFPDKTKQISEGTQLLLYLQIKGILTNEEVDDILVDAKEQYENFLNQFK